MPQCNKSVTQKGSPIIHNPTDNQQNTSQMQSKTNNSGSITLPNNSNAKPKSNLTHNNTSQNTNKHGVNPHRIGTKAWQDFNNLNARI